MSQLLSQVLVGETVTPPASKSHVITDTVSKLSRTVGSYMPSYVKIFGQDQEAEEERDAILKMKEKLIQKVHQQAQSSVVNKFHDELTYLENHMVIYQKVQDEILKLVNHEEISSY